MPRLRCGVPLALSIALAGVIGVSPAAAAPSVAFGSAAQSSALAASAVFGPLSPQARPIPIGPSHILGPKLSSPPDTAFCQANFGISCYEPAQFQQAYDLKPLYAEGLNGAGSTIVIVDSFGSPTIASDLQTFDTTFGLPAPPSFNVIAPAGAIPAYPSDPFGASDRSGWAFETTLDVEWAHVIAPGAKILLVETPTSETEGVQGFPEIVTAENYVVDHNLGDVITQSFGSTEQDFPNAQSLLNLRSAFVNAQQHNVTVLGASGDNGATDLFPDESCCYTFPVNSWPSSDPLVTSVGGTQLSLDANGNRLAPDVVWNDGFGAGGGGKSTVFSRPSFQDGVSGVVGAARGTPDISMSAAVDGAVDVFYSFDDYGQSPTVTGPEWQLVGGTSEASPLFSGVVAIADQAAGYRLGWLNPTLYSRYGGDLAGGITDITSGNNSFDGVTGYNALPGYDMASGLGTPDTAKFVAALAHAATTTTASVTPTSSAFGTSITLSATVAPTPTNDPFTPTGSVSFYLDGSSTPVATVPLVSGHASVTLSGLPVGAHTVTAVYGGDSKFLGSSTAAPVAFTVTASTTVTGNHPGALVVPAGSTVLVRNASIGGSVAIDPGGSLDLENSTVSGGLADSGGGALRVCGSHISGTVAVSSATGFVLIGDATDGCAPNTIGGALDVKNNVHGVQVIGNTVSGPVLSRGNAGAGPFPDDTSANVSGN
ncbi:MAG TPA: Ig-like domain repeat protein [Solirubrobacteraceae bacterium]|nr:Ig-like domain repeat protein [Solirubrobacteraceae bacterium]